MPLSTADGKRGRVMIPEREREALMRLTMCARNECDMCKYRPYIPKKCYERATEAMNILADALNADRKTENCSEIPNNSKERSE